MKTVNLNEIEDDCIPEGKYVSEIADIEEKETRKGDAMWSIRYQVVDGPHTGAFVFDNIVFAGAGMKRFKWLCEAIDLGPEVTLDTALFEDKRVVIDVAIDDDPEWGRRNKVSFRGFSNARSDIADNDPEDDFDDGDVPF